MWGQGEAGQGEALQEAEALRSEETAHVPRQIPSSGRGMVQGKAGQTNLRL